jgi:hypothetical protein
LARFDLAYVAHSERCVLLIDDEGVCRSIVPKADVNDKLVLAAQRCIGARVVASLDPEVPGFLTDEPRVGACLLFAVVEDGRVSLARFGPLESFETVDVPVAPATVPDVLVPLEPESSHDSTGTFARSQLGALSRSSLDAAESSLERSAHLACIPEGEEEAVPTPDDSQLAIVTSTYTRAEVLATLREKHEKVDDDHRSAQDEAVAQNGRARISGFEFRVEPRARLLLRRRVGQGSAE